MRLCLLRHGEAGYQASRDADRRLTLRGEADVATTLGRGQQYLRELDIVISSPYCRARQTAAIAVQASQFAGELLFSSDLLPNASIAGVATLLEGIKFEQVLLVGHQPLLGSLLAWLTDRWHLATDMGTATLAVVDTSYLARGCGELLALIHAGQG